MSDAHRQVVREINEIIPVVVASGLADDQNLAYEERTGPSRYRVRYDGDEVLGAALRDRPYEETYELLRDSRSYNLLMLDGAVIQMVYEFGDGDLLRHRLAFLPSPSLLEFQNEPDLYLEEQLYADVIERGVVTVPLRFDFDRRHDVAKPISHPISHLTLGQYSGCRVPVTAGVTPHAFMDFILGSFYRTATTAIGASLPTVRLRFDECIDASERRVVHIGIPTHR